ncbi:MAG: PilZ domain-containing protein, partial [Motiliproteus sp.]|nr:PilZ domain-containing protein [Motiliproteus sp.]
MKPSHWNPEEHRRSPRIEVDLAAEVSSDWQCTAPARVVNLSHHGIAIEGPGALIELVFPNFNHQVANQRQAIQIRAGLLE